MMEEQNEEFHYESSSWWFFITPALFISFLASLLIPYLVSPPLWSLVLPASKNPPRSNMHFHTVLTSTIHAVISSVLALYMLWFGMMGSNRLFSKLPLGFVTIQISLGFFAGDLIVCLLDPKLRADWVGVIHHLAGVAGLAFCLFYQGIFMFFVVYRLITELSQPFVNLRYILYKFCGKDRIPYICASIVMFIVFFFCRIIIILWHWCVISTVVATDEAAREVHLFFRVGLVGIYLIFDIVNILWWYAMMKDTPSLFKAKGKSVESCDTEKYTQALQNQGEVN
jgi:hypothetical protein